jgi:HAMP domain-containing protein
MPAFRLHKLRHKFLAITSLAIAIPFLFYGYLLYLSLASIDDIAHENLEGEILRIEAYLRDEMRSLGERAAYFSSLPEASDLLSNDWEASWSGKEERRWLKNTTSIDLMIAVPRQSPLHPLFVRARPENRNPLAEEVGEWLSRYQGVSGCCGLVSLGDSIFLLSIQSIPENKNGTPSDSNLQGWVVLGEDVSNRLFAKLNEQTSNRYEIGYVDPSSSQPKLGTTEILQENSNTLSIRKFLPGLNPEQSFYLDVNLQSGLYNHLKANLLWFPALALCGLLVTVLIATGWATLIVLRPLRRFVGTMASVTGPEAYGIRAPEDGSDEIGQLAVSFNRLMERLESVQRERVEAEKLETLQATVITLAHQINNPLTALLGQAELLLLDNHLDARGRNSLETIREMSLRISGVIQKLQDLKAVGTVSYLRSQHMVSLDVAEAKEPRAPEPHEVLR